MPQFNQSTPSKQRVALLIQYLGTRFHGWQEQPNHATIQGAIEQAIALGLAQAQLEQLAQTPIRIHGAGRTDAGVHAAAQLAHFDICSPIPPHRWAKVINPHLPEDILIRASTAVAPRWHSQFSACWRRYRYTLYTDPCPNLFLRQTTWHYYHAPLQVSRMKEALTPLVGNHHLSAFHRANSSRSHSWVEVQEVDCYRQGHLVQMEIQANGFLYGMVRLLMGLLVEVGTGARSPEEFTEIWQSERRDLVKYSAPAKGLCLLRVGYPEPPFPKTLWFESQPTFSFPSPSETIIF